ncbi:hypothetical protein BaRGS_00015564 [Batillaria attramentaria]|uniref:Transmembrane protein n=1 Tax=Batillaria attramentaria TaxID=370345 RepID=A0ABD0L2D7_9CAEN
MNASDSDGVGNQLELPCARSFMTLIGSGVFLLASAVSCRLPCIHIYNKAGSAQTYWTRQKVTKLGGRLGKEERWGSRRAHNVSTLISEVCDERKRHEKKSFSCIDRYNEKRETQRDREGNNYT